MYVHHTLRGLAWIILLFGSIVVLVVDWIWRGIWPPWILGTAVLVSLVNIVMMALDGARWIADKLDDWAQGRSADVE